MKKELRPFRCRPIFKEKIWGGQKLAQLFGKNTSYANCGESWEVSDLEEGQSIVDSGPHEGKSLGEMVEYFGKSLVGSSTSMKGFPLLIKLLDAAQDLSVQVHPGQTTSHLFERASSKDECWIILNSEDGKIAHGLKSGTTMETLETAIANNDCQRYLNEIAVKEGDAIRIPPGTVHAIRKGVVLLEIQEPSDTTFRLYDYGRKDKHGNMRALHVEDALKAIELDQNEEIKSLINSPHSLLFNTPSYRVEVLYVQNAQWEVSDESVQVLINLGDADLSLGDVHLSPFQSAVIPANVNLVTIKADQMNRVVLAGVSGILAKNLKLSVE